MTLRQRDDTPFDHPYMDELDDGVPSGWLWNSGLVLAGVLLVAVIALWVLA